MSSNDRLERAADKLEIIEVMSKYERLYDTSQVDPLMELFVDECVVDYGDLGRLEGKSAVRDYLESYFAEETDFEDWFHIIANPWVELDGDEATGYFQLFGPFTIKDVGAAWLFGFYEIEFVRTDGDWLIDTLYFWPKHFTPFDDGWERNPDGAITS